ncbi:MAG TPA: glycosyltransferase family 4 protein [Caulobacteraceae bacterium]
MTAPRLYYLDDIPTPYRLGVQRRIARAWPGAFKIAYCAGSEPGREWTHDFEGLDTEVLPGRQFRPSRQVNPFSFKFNPAVLSSLKAFRPDVVVLSGYVHPTVHLAAHWCRRNGAAYGIASESSAANSSSSGLRYEAKRLIAGPLVRGMSFGLPVGMRAADYLRRLGPTDAPMFLFPNTPDTSLVAAQAERMAQPGAREALLAELGIPAGAPIILFVGRMIDAKRPLDLLQAFQRLGGAGADAVVVFVGDGPLTGELKDAAAGDQRVIFTGWLSSPAQVAALMAVSTVMVLPSQHETWGAVVNEAMAAGTPVIASDRVGSAVELIESGVNGVIFSVGEVDELARAIGALLADEAARVRMGEAALVTALSRGEAFATSNFLAAVQHGLEHKARKPTVG